MRNRKSGGLETRKRWYGRLFCLPWIIGVIPFFLISFITTIYYSLCNLSLSSNGLDLSFIAFGNYSFIFTKDPNFIKELWNAFVNMIYEVPFILSVSIFLALLLNQKFRGRTFFRAIMFLPVIVTSGVVISILQSDVNAAQAMNGIQGQSFMKMTSINDMLLSLGMDVKVIEVISKILSTVSDMVLKCGVQILLFLAGLQSIPASFYEAASVEGANKWECFWKITFPSLTSILLTGIVYTIIDSFTSWSNNIMVNCIQPAFDDMKYAVACSMSLTYSLMVMVLLGIVFLLLSKRVVYTEK